jgi:hypothetical protein
MVTPRCILASLLLAGPAAAGVLAHYPFDTGFTDTSGNGRHGTLTDVTTAGNSGIASTSGSFRFGNGALNLSADRDYVAIPSHTFTSGSAYTIAFWARKSPSDTGDAANWDMVIGQRNNDLHFIGLNDVNGTGMRWRGSAKTTNYQADFGVTKDNAWHHYALVASGSTLTLYVDGELFSSATDKQTEFIIDTIGEAYVSTSDYDFNGQIDEVWIYDEALAATAVRSLFQSNDSTAPPAYAGFHHRYDGNFNDSSSAANHGTAAGAAAITTDPSAIAAGSGALALDGADNSCVTLPVTGSYTANQRWSATWWARRLGLGASKGMVMGDASNTTDFIWLNDNSTGLRFRSSNNTTLDFTVAKDSDLHHYALVADGTGNLTLYVDGQSTQTLSGNTSFAVNSIGKAYPTNSLHYNFHGTLDEVRLMPASLSATQVADLYADEKPETQIADVTRVRVILLGGQSNADGRAVVADLPLAFQAPQSDVDFYYRTELTTGTLTTLRPGLSETSQFGPEILLGSRLAAIHAHEPGTRVAIIKYANGGTNLHTQWKAGGNETTTGDGPEYVTFQQTVTAGRAAINAKYPNATLELDSMVWMQGESDATAATAGAYQANLTAFIADVRATYGASLPFMIGRLSNLQTNLDATARNTVRAAQDAIATADPYTGIISTDGFGMKTDNLHFDAAGQQAMGSAFAEEAAYYSWMIETFTTADINAGRAEPNADADGDGQSNRTEFLGASNPNSGDSRFIASMSVSGPTAGTISYPSVPSRLYVVERFIEETGIWSIVLPFSPGDSGQTNRPLTLSQPRAMFRVTSKLP